MDGEATRQFAAALGQRGGQAVKITISDGDHRTNEQNRLQHLWNAELAEQRKDANAEYYRAYNKLCYGVPILRAEDDDFRAKYDKHVKGLTFEIKIALMSEPFDFPVTRLMTKKQKSRFLDDVFRGWTEKGMMLTLPNEVPR